MSNTQKEIAAPDKLSIKPKLAERISATPTRFITYTAVFSALAVLMKFVGQYLTITPEFKITLIYTVWLAAAACLGPVGGGGVCLISDILGAIILPRGAINPLLIAGNTLYGVLAALSFRFTPSRSYIAKFIVSGIVCTLICTCLLNTFAIWYWYGYNELFGFWIYFATRRAFQPLVAAINIVIVVCLIPLLKRIKLLPPQRSALKGD